MNHSDSESGSDIYWDSEDEDNQVGDPDWEFSSAARAWEKRRQIFSSLQTQKLTKHPQNISTASILKFEIWLFDFIWF